MPSLSRRFAVSALATLVLACAGARAAQPDIEPAAAAMDLYARITARDLQGVVRYLPSEGFTEIAPDSTSPHTLTAAAVKGLFDSGLAIALSAENLRVQRFENVAVVTGVRAGGVGSKATASPAERDALTMIWTLGPEGWLLRHVHLSALLPQR